MEKSKVSNQEFHFNYGPQIGRIWNHLTKRGMDFNELKDSQINIDEITHIFIRKDDWVIASTSEGADSCRQLWPNEWKREIIR